MKLCRICPSFTEKQEGSGLELHVYNLTKEQKKLGVDIDVVTAGNSAGFKKLNGIRIHRVKKRSPFQLTSGFDILRTVDTLAESEGFDVLQVHNPMVLPFFPKNMSKIPLVFSIHATLMDFKNLFSFRSLHKSVKGYLEFYFVAKKLCERAARITTGSSDEKYELSKFLGINPDKIVPVHGKANTKFFRPGIKTDLKEKLDITGPVVLSVGRFVRKKGYTYLVRAFRQLVDEVPDANLVLVGASEGDDDFDAIIKLVKNLDLQENVKILPVAPKKELLYYFSMCDLYVQPSISEGFPQTVQDAMSCGKPVITSAAYGAKDVIKDGYNGFVVPKRDSLLLAKRMAELLQDESRMKKFGKLNRKIAVEELGWDKTARKHYEICKAAIEDSKIN